MNEAELGRGSQPSEELTLTTSDDALEATLAADPAARGLRPSNRGAFSVLGRLERGEPIGRYVVLGRLGAGAMGVVYAAYDADLDRKVAVKLLLSHKDREVQGSARLLREAQAMAKLSHPNVITVHDVGTHHERVFVAMEFIEGGTLRDWMDAGHHSWRAVLSRLLPAGRGLAAAHQRGLIHRDFKPANVLLGRPEDPTSAGPNLSPSPLQRARLGGQGSAIRVADFGLARQADADAEADADSETDSDADADEASAQDDGGRDAPPGRASDQTYDGPGQDWEPKTFEDETLDDELREFLSDRSNSMSARLTQTGAKVGTPAYMAPEQYMGDSVDARADQFAFCVALYEALYGERPFAGDGLHAIMFKVHEGTIREAPKDRPVPTWIRRAVLRGLAVDPEDRWPDMATLLAELGRDRLARRRRLALGALVIAAFAGLSGLALVDSDEASEAAPPQCTRANADLAFADTWGPERRGAVEAHAESLGTHWSARALVTTASRLDRWADDWRAGWLDACEATHVRKSQSEELLDGRMLCLQRRRRRLDGLAASLATADEALIERAPRVIDELGLLTDCADTEALAALAPPPADPERRAAIEGAQNQLDGIYAHLLAGENDEAARGLDALAPVIEALGSRPLLAELRGRQGRLLSELGEREAAETHMRESLNLAIAVGDDRHATRTIKYLALIINESGTRHEHALHWLDVGESLAQRHGDDPALLGLIHHARSKVLESLGRYPEALAAAEAGLAAYRESHASDDPLIGDLLFLVATAHYRVGDLDGAITFIEAARIQWGDQLGPDHPRSRATITALGVFSMTKGETAAAIAYFERALESSRRVYDPGHTKIASAMSNLAVVYVDDGRPAEAIELYGELLAIYRSAYGDDSIYVGHALANMAMAMLALERPDEAMELGRQAFELIEAARGAEHPELATAWDVLGQAHLALGQLDAAYANFDKARQRSLDAHGPEYTGLRETYFKLAFTELRRGRAPQAREWLEAIDALPQPDGDDHRLESDEAFLRAQIHDTLGEPERARPHAERALAHMAEHGDGRRWTQAEVRAWLDERPDESARRR